MTLKSAYCLIVLCRLYSINHVRNIPFFQQVVGVTCMGCSHALLRQRTFDFCIIDEATQVLLPSILKALYSARKFVLIGDPEQLPPVVHNFEARSVNESFISDKVDEFYYNY